MKYNTSPLQHSEDTEPSLALPAKQEEPMINCAEYDLESPSIVIPPQMWFVRFSESEVAGPFTTAALRAAFLAQEIHFQQEVAPAPQGPWMAAYKRPEFSDCIPTQQQAA